MRRSRGMRIGRRGGGIWRSRRRGRRRGMKRRGRKRGRGRRKKEEGLTGATVGGPKDKTSQNITHITLTSQNKSTYPST
jgi:hypothetical protein